MAANGIPPDLMMPLARAISAAFGAGEFDRILVRTTGRSLFKFYTHEQQPMDDIAYQTLDRLDQLGFQHVVLAAAVLSRPDDAGLRDLVGRACPAALDGVPGIESQVRDIIGGANYLRAQLSRDDVRAVVEETRGTLTAVTAGVAACWLAHHGRDHLIAEAEKHGETLQAMFRRLVRASAHRPPEWDGANMGAGIVNALKLIEAPLDQERGLESGAFEPRERAPADELRAFLTELLGTDPGLTDGFILAHGTELASALLARKLHPGSGIPLSPALRSGLTGPAKALF